MGKTVFTVYNPEWQEGMSASIRCGLSALLASEPQLSGVVLMVCDQPFVEASLLDSLLHIKSGSGKGIVACQYQDTLGTPVLFDKAYFEELLFLRGKEGAKKLLFRHSEDVAAVLSLRWCRYRHTGGLRLPNQVRVKALILKYGT